MARTAGSPATPTPTGALVKPDPGLAADPAKPPHLERVGPVPVPTGRLEDRRKIPECPRAEQDTELLHGVATQGLDPVDGPVDPAGRGHVGAREHHPYRIRNDSTGRRTIEMQGFGSVASGSTADPPRARAGRPSAPFQLRRFQLTRPADADVAWLAGVMDRRCRTFGLRVEQDSEGSLEAT